MNGISELVALRRGVFKISADGETFLWDNAEAVSLGRPTDEELGFIDLLAAGPIVADAAMAELVGALRPRGWLDITVSLHGNRVYTLAPSCPPPPEPEAGAPNPGPLMLSRFAVVRGGGDHMVVQSPRAWCDVRVYAPAALSVIGALTGVHPDPEPGPLDALRARMLHDLQWAGLAVSPGAEDTELRLRQWDAHELWFHYHSRLSAQRRREGGYGATFWASGRFAPPPVRPEPFSGPAIDLHTPDLDRLRVEDASLTSVLEDRRSIREYDEEHPLSRDQLGEFLYRSARTRGIRVAGGMELCSRPYPSGGALYELEIYPVVARMDGLTSGMYHYDSHAHQLRFVRDAAEPSVRRLLRDAMAASLLERSPQVLFAISARAGRMMWKYQAMTYAMILKHVGVLYQTMYGVATAMGLAPCALGHGDATAFSAATGRDPLVECGVGEFMLGSAPPTARYGRNP